ncbi:sigma-70 family RNA polymerase sigma factor [Streptomyces polyrhachis]|uniref:Sigma-70 family RNA polymerase sigma factor n=1 Tax=Streptomyces polyrhachis TaxID=1282885 RepID=A0ABW2GGV2_9ACTN
MAQPHDARRWDRKMQQRLTRGEAAALGELYDRHASMVYGLVHRVLGDDEAAQEITADVFAYLWQHPDAYDPARGQLRSWFAGLAQKRAVRRLRWDELNEHKEHGRTPTAAEEREAERRIRLLGAHARADFIVQSMPATLRASLELAYFQRRDYRQVAAEFGITEAEARRRLRLGLQLVSSADTPAGGGRHDGQGRVDA